MARLPRFNIAGYTQHIFIRGNNKQVVFNEDRDYAVYIEKLDEACQRFSCALHAYALLDNHVHLLLTPADESGISKVMQTLGRYYVQYFNFKYDRSGTLWEGRYRATLVDTKVNMTAVHKFIEQTPLRLGKCKDLVSYFWSSYQQNALSKAGVSVTPHKSLFTLFSDPITYQNEMQNLLPDDTVKEIEQACFKGWVLGTDEFKREVELASGRRVVPLPKGGDRRSEAYKKSLEAKKAKQVNTINNQQIPNKMDEYSKEIDSTALIEQDQDVHTDAAFTDDQENTVKKGVAKKEGNKSKKTINKQKREPEIQKSFDDMTQQSLF